MRELICWEQFHFYLCYLLSSSFTRSSAPQSSSSTHPIAGQSNFDELRFRIPSRDEIFEQYPLNPKTPQFIREAWVETLLASEIKEDQIPVIGAGATEDEATEEASKEEVVAEEAQDMELVRLHPDIWSVRPRIDIIELNLEWQMKYKTVSYEKQLNRYDMPKGTIGRPWPQKGKFGALCLLACLLDKGHQIGLGERK